MPLFQSRFEGMNVRRDSRLDGKEHSINGVYKKYRDQMFKKFEYQPYYNKISTRFNRLCRLLHSIMLDLDLPLSRIAHLTHIFYCDASSFSSKNLLITEYAPVAL